MGERKMILSNAAFSSSNVFEIHSETNKGTINSSTLHFIESLQKDLNELVHLPNGWDGYNGIPVKFENAYFTIQILEAICFDDTPKPCLVPGSKGDLQIEWHEGLCDIELHVKSPLNVDAWVKTPQTDEDGIEYHLTSDFRIISKYIKIMMEAISDEVAAA
jgi:hypothetical protein